MNVQIPIWNFNYFIAILYNYSRMEKAARMRNNLY